MGMFASRLPKIRHWWDGMVKSVKFNKFKRTCLMKLLSGFHAPGSES